MPTPDELFHYLQVGLSILGGAYLLALAIVRATPTTRDDEALARAAGWVRWAVPWVIRLAVLFGLDPERGRKLKLPDALEADAGGTK